MSNERKCKNCHWFCDSNSPEADMQHGGDHGVCRANPPLSGTMARPIVHSEDRECRLFSWVNSPFYAPGRCDVQE